MNERLNILVLGVGGNVSQGILKALAIGSLRCRVVGACVSPAAFGLFTVDRAYVSPPAGDARFLPWLIDVCKRERIHGILSGVEPVLDVLACRRDLIRSETGAVSVVSDPASLAIAGDKLATCRWLRDRGLHYPRFAPGDDEAGALGLARDAGYPLIAKPRRSKGAHGIVMIEDERQLAGMRRADYVIEEYLGTPEEEFTAGCFSDANGGVRGCIVFRRELFEGTTLRAEAGAFPEVRGEAMAIARALRPAGPCNVQMRRSGSAAVCFEINLRFSGTTPIRARLGFNDVEAAVRHFVMGEPAVDLPVIEQGVATRYWNELYVSPEALGELRRKGRLESPNQYPRVLEDYGTGV